MDVKLFGEMDAAGHELVAHCHDSSTGLRAIVAIHSTRLGPALGGTRFYPYASESDALRDVLRLSRGMTYKASVAGLDFGGGKGVIIGDPAVHRTEAMIRAYGCFINTLSGRYLTAEDVGTTLADMDLIRLETPWVTGTSLALGGSGDPSPATAWGIMCAMRAVRQATTGDSSLSDVAVVVAGIGKVGAALVTHLLSEGARVTIADVNTVAVDALREATGVAAVDPGQAHTVSCDIYSPCALGAALTPGVIAELGCRAVVGAANNQLATPDCADQLAGRGILYAPDYVVNAGGIINISQERSGYDVHRAMEQVGRIHTTVLEVLDLAQREAITTAAAADRMAERRISSVGQIAHLRPFRTT
jgi:glutamate dehydrogenase/leucine dehydrogenase